MATTQTKDFTYGGDLGGYFAFTAKVRVAVSIPDDLTRIDVTCTPSDFSYTTKDTSGYGFINMGGIMRYTPYASQRHANSDAVPETYAAALAEMNQVYPGFAAAVIIGGYAADNGSSIRGEMGGSRVSWSVPITDDMWASPGRLKDLQLVTGFTRYRDNDAGQSVCDVGVGTFKIHLSDFEFLYYPFARRLNGQWVSLDRSGGAFRVREGGQWVAAQCDQVDNTPMRGRVRKNGTWQKGALYA